MTDPIADMLTQIRNAVLVRKAEVVLPHSKFKQQLAELFQRQGLLESVAVQERDARRFLALKLRYSAGKPAISGIKRVSTPGQRLYVGADEIPRTQSGYGITVISTSQGLLTDQQARKAHIGGELVCQVW